MSHAVLRPFISTVTLLLVGGCGGLGQEPPKPLDLLLVAGQSNAVGFDARANELPLDPVDESVLLWWRVGDPPPDEHDSVGLGWVPLQPQTRGEPRPRESGQRQYGNFRFPEGGFGPEMGIARTLAGSSPTLGVIKVAFSGTSLARDWDPNGEGETGACYRALVSEVEAATRAARELGFTPRLRGFFWVQGESDGNEADAALYQGRFETLLSTLRARLGGSSPVTCLLAVNTQFGGGKNVHLQSVVEAQRRVGAADPLSAYVDTAGATVANGAHFDAAGTLAVGQRMGRALLKLERAYFR